MQYIYDTQENCHYFTITDDNSNFISFTNSRQHKSNFRYYIKSVWQYFRICREFHLPQVAVVARYSRASHLRRSHAHRAFIFAQALINRRPRTCTHRPPSTATP